MTVSLYQNGTDVLDLPLSDFVVPGGDGSGVVATWMLKSPITTSQLALGSYDAKVTATDSGGDSIGGVAAGTLYFQDIVQFPVFTSDGTNFDYDHQDVTFSGQAVVLAPDGTTTPFADGPLDLFGAPQTIPLVTDSSGAFTVTAQAVPGGSYWIGYGGDSPTLSGYSSAIATTVTTSPVQVNATMADAAVNYGVPDSVSGTVTYTDRGVTKPLPGNVVTLWQGDYANGPSSGTAVTDANGQFTMPVPTTEPSGDWLLQTTSSPYLQLGSATLHLSVAQPNAITDFSATVSRFAVVGYSGCVSGGPGNVLIESASRPTGPWVRLGKALAYSYGSCTQNGHPAYQFSGKAKAKFAAAYYRAEWVATPDWQHAVSSSVYLWKYLTKITSFSVSSRSVARNGYVTASGRLWTRSKSGKWRPYAHQPVLVIFKYQGTWYRYKHEPKTNSVGRFSKSVKVYVSAPFAAVYLGNSTHFATGSKHIGVTASGASPAAGLAQLGLVAMRGIWPVLAVVWDR